MSEKVQWKSGTLLSPVPAVMVTCGDENISNIFTVAWTGIVNSDPAKTYISVRPSRYSYNIIKNKREFVINLTSAALVRSADLCGILSGSNTDKFEKCGLHKAKANTVACPLLDESPVSIECKVTDIISLGTHDMFLADITCVDINKELITPEGKFNIDKAGLMAYAHGTYYSLGKKLGTFGFSVKKKKKRPQRTDK